MEGLRDGGTGRWRDWEMEGLGESKEYGVGSNLPDSTSADGKRKKKVFIMIIEKYKERIE